MIEKSYTEEEIAEIVRRHGLPRYPKLALYREKLSRKAKAEPNFRFYCLYGWKAMGLYEMGKRRPGQCQFHMESRMRENCTYGLTRGRAYPARGAQLLLRAVRGRRRGRLRKRRRERPAAHGLPRLMRGGRTISPPCIVFFAIISGLI